MKKTKILLSLFLALVLALTSIVMMASCDDEEEPSVPSGSNGSTGSSTPGTDSGTPPSTGSSNGGGQDDSDAKKSSYTIKIFNKMTSKPIPDVSVYVQEEANDTAIAYARGKTDENGIVVLNVEPKHAKYVYVEGLPKGYVHEDYYALGSTGVDIGVETAIIENDSSLAGKQLALGDVMYDFKLTTVDGEEITLSKLFADGKKAVVLNFWYTTCTYCIEEFPYLQGAYEEYKEKGIEIIGINAYSSDNEKSITTFLADFKKPGYYVDEGCELTFPMAKDTANIQDAFGFNVNPCTVVIDRYGVISMIQVGGVLGQRYFTNAFDHFVSNNYTQELYSSIYDLSPMIKPDVEMSPEAEIKDAVVQGDINISFRPETDEDDSEYAWPFIVVEKDGEKCIASTNMDIDNSFAILYVDVDLKAGQALMFDYYVSTQSMYDVLHIIVDNSPIYTISGRPLEDDDGNLIENPWQACCPWVATEDGTYEVAFCYIKDESEKEGEDKVYLDNFRVVDKGAIENETYIPRYAATDLQDDNTFASYVDVFFNENDGYYHVGNVNGPLLLAGLQGVNTQFYLKMPEEQRTTVVNKLTADGEFIYNGEDVYTPFILYCQFATNSRLYGFCPVTEQLKGFLEEYVKQNGFSVNENTWLELCSYYSAYGTDKELEDPTKGLSTFNAFEAIETKEGEEGFKNVVTYTQIIMPRGFLYKFVPTKSGVYRITSSSTQEVDGWVFTGSFEQWNKENGGDRILYIDSTIGERHCPELLIDPDGDGTYERDFKNCSMIGYFEEGVEYYIDIAYYDVYGAGTFAFDLKYVGESFDVFVEASPGVFTRDEGSDIIAGGIDVKLCTDESDPRYGYFCHLLPNGELGSILYADFHFTTNIFPTQTLKTLVESGAFDMSKTEIDHEAYVFKVNYYDKDGVDALEKLWGEDFEANWEYYQMDDIIDGKYHGNGPDYTEAMKKYIAMLDNGTGGTGSEVIYPERQGCVPVDAELAAMLQAIMDKFTFPNVEHSWTKLCYYYNSLDVIPTVEEKLLQLEAMVDGAEIANEEIKAEIEAIVESLEASLESWSIITVKRNLIDDAMIKIYALIEADKNQQ
ncbi:MAG: TlpA family protein disulfide reductase [Ruminococcaceae bacterium]|nr:TlpA family protein disulfide reductase [Oscillospiraceae bacterium]